MRIIQNEDGAFYAVFENGAAELTIRTRADLDIFTERMQSAITRGDMLEAVASIIKDVRPL